MAYQDTISDVLITQFSDTVFELASQTKARMRPVVEMEQVTALDKMFPRIGAVEAQDLTDRFPTINASDVSWDNRRLTASRVGVAMMVDEFDKDRMLADPNSVLAKRAAEALERKFDRVAIASALATVYTGRQGTTAVTAATDGVITVDATAGMTYDILLQINENFQKVEVGTETPVGKYLLISEQEHTQLMREGTLINGDFTRQYVIDKGGMIRALDFDIIIFGSATSNPMLTVTNNVRACLAICTGAIKVGITRNWQIEVEKVNNRWNTTQVLASGILGGLRMEGIRIQQVNTTAY